jgi:predicted nuclease of predicted toxin-antitoxin system
MLLLDQGLPRSTVRLLRDEGIDAVHVGDLGLAEASDATILERARARGEIVVTLDADFHAQLALSGPSAPSVIRIRVEGLRAEDLANLLARITERCAEDLEAGAIVSVTESDVRIRRLPIVR